MREAAARIAGVDEGGAIQVVGRAGDSGVPDAAQGCAGQGTAAVVVPHGGPWARDNWGYNPMAQFFANRGYAVLMPNFRGSTGYGKKFLNAGNGEWGRKMQDDITWGVKYLVAEGIADPKRVGIMGGSYGGYAVLAGVAFTPDLYRAAVDIVGPSNLLTLLDSIPPYWEAGRKLMYARMADPGTPAGKAWMKERSPLNSADKIKTPLMVVQGANDPRVNQRRSRADRDRAARPRFPGGVPAGAGRRPRLRASGEQHGDVHGGREIPGEVSGRPLIRQAGRRKW